MIIEEGPVDAVFDVKSSGAEAAELGKVGAAAEEVAEVVRNGADVSSFGAGDI
jgi:hypothetical protein